jgi:hypothetical protein
LYLILFCSICPYIYVYICLIFFFFFFFFYFSTTSSSALLNQSQDFIEEQRDAWKVADAANTERMKRIEYKRRSELAVIRENKTKDLRKRLTIPNFDKLIPHATVFLPLLFFMCDIKINLVPYASIIIIIIISIWSMLQMWIQIICVYVYMHNIF